MNKWMILITIFLLLLVSYSANASTYFVHQFNENIRIVLSQFPCKDKSGMQAAAQRIDGQAISGCWLREPPNMIKIVWSNNDFAVFREKDFSLTQE